MKRFAVILVWLLIGVCAGTAFAEERIDFPGIEEYDVVGIFPLGGTSWIETRNVDSYISIMLAVLPRSTGDEGAEGMLAELVDEVSEVELYNEGAVSGYAARRYRCMAGEGEVIDGVFVSTDSRTLGVVCSVAREAWYGMTEAWPEGKAEEFVDGILENLSVTEGEDAYASADRNGNVYFFDGRQEYRVGTTDEYAVGEGGELIESGETTGKVETEYYTLTIPDGIAGKYRTEVRQAEDHSISLTFIDCESGKPVFSIDMTWLGDKELPQTDEITSFDLGCLNVTRLGNFEVILNIAPRPEDAGEAWDRIFGTAEEIVRSVNWKGDTLFMPLLGGLLDVIE